MITNAELRSRFLDEPTMYYFRSKLAHLAHEEVQRRIEETLKFLFIVSECHGAIPVTKEIDEIWHYWILQTQEYMKLCELLPTGSFVHHSSNDYLRYFDPSVGVGNTWEEDVKMLALYFRNFGPFDESRTRYWLLASHLVSRFGWTVEQLNDWLNSPTPQSAGPVGCIPPGQQRPSTLAIPVIEGALSD